MIKFFRKIRQRLIGEGNIKRYLIYAFGEVFLIIIGILIALFISDWNNDRKLRKIEVENLKLIANGLQEDISKIEYLKQQARQRIDRLNVLDSLYKSPNPKYEPKMATLFGEIGWAETLELNRGPYEGLKSQDLNLISDDSIRQGILHIYETAHRQCETSNDWMKQSAINMWEPLMANFHLTTLNDLSPMDEKNIWKNPLIPNFISYQKGVLKEHQLDVFGRAQKEMIVLRDRINRHLAEDD